MPLSCQFPEQSTSKSEHKLSASAVDQKKGSSKGLPGSHKQLHHGKELPAGYYFTSPYSSKCLLYWRSRVVKALHKRGKLGPRPPLHLANLWLLSFFCVFFPPKKGDPLREVP